MTSLMALIIHSSMHDMGKRDDNKMKVKIFFFWQSLLLMLPLFLWPPKHCALLEYSETVLNLSPLYSRGFLPASALSITIVESGSAFLSSVDLQYSLLPEQPLLCWCKPTMEYFSFCASETCCANLFDLKQFSLLHRLPQHMQVSLDSEEEWHECWRNIFLDDRALKEFGMERELYISRAFSELQNYDQ